MATSEALCLSWLCRLRSRLNLSSDSFKSQLEWVFLISDERLVVSSFRLAFHLESNGREFLQEHLFSMLRPLSLDVAHYPSPALQIHETPVLNIMPEDVTLFKFSLSLCYKFQIPFFNQRSQSFIFRLSFGFETFEDFVILLFSLLTLSFDQLLNILFP